MPREKSEMMNYKAKMTDPSRSQSDNLHDARSAKRRDSALATRTVYSSEQLFGSEREVAIQHDGSVYRLRITRQRKLILNK